MISIKSSAELADAAVLPAPERNHFHRFQEAAFVNVLKSIVVAVTIMSLNAAAPAGADDYPSKPVHVIVVFPPGGSNDIVARIVFQKVSEQLGQQFVIENRGGAGGTIGEAMVAKAAPDGYSILHDGTAYSVNGALYSNLSFDYNRDFDPVALVSLVPNILVMTPSLPVNTFADVIAYAKAAPDGIDMASSGNGTLQHLSLEMFRFMTGAKVNHVPYRGGGPALNDVMGGQVKLFFSNGSSVVGIIQGGKVRAIAHTGKGRLKSLPDIPPASDTLPGFEAYEWNGVFVPHGTPPAIVRTLNAAINEAIRAPDVKERFEQLNIETRPNTPEEFRAFVQDQMERWGKVVKEAKIKLG
jgi:tripartite-type tricarboxylate transporter receptor subunit TctC